MGNSSPPPTPPPSSGRPDTAATSGELHTSDIRGVLDLPVGDQGAKLPKQIGHYQILKRLGRGGMGEVLLGQRSDDQFHKRVAIKLIRKGIDDATDGREVLKRFELERQVLAALNHPNIARLLDAGQMPEPDGRPYFVMEYVEGESIDEYCDRMQLNVDQRLAMFTKVCAAVHHAHQNLVIHRDIKPSNILVDGSGEPKLMDFGIAKLINPAMSGMTFVTQFDRGPMTPEYASPEQISGKPVTTSSDVYALGVLLYEMLTGRRPYQLKSRAMDAMAQAILNEEPERPSTAVMHEFAEPTHDGHTRTLTAASLAKPREGEATRLKRKLAGDVDNIVLMAMRKSPQRRYPSAEAMSEDIRRHLEGMTVKAVPETWLYVAQKFVRRNRLGVTAAALIVTTFIAGSIIVAVAWRREQAARQRADLALAASRQFAAATESALVQLASPAAGEEATRARLDASDAYADAVASIQSLSPDVDFRSERAAALAVAGKVRTDIRGGSTGDAAQGVKLLQESVELRRAVLVFRPDDATSRRGLAIALVYLGDALTRSGGEPAGAAAYDEAVKITRETKGGGATGEQAKRLLAVALLARADVFIASRQLDKARPLVDESLRLRREFADAAPSSALRQRDLSVGLGRAAELAAEADDLGTAERLLRESLAIREQALRSDPSPRAERDVAIMAAKLAQFLLSKPAPATAEALTLLERQESLTRKIAEGDASNRRAQLDLARALNDLAEHRLDAKASAPAESSSAEALQVLSRQPGQARTSPEKFELARAHELRGRSLRAMGKDGDNDLRAAADLLSGLATADPNTPAFAEGLKRVQTLLRDGP